MAVVNSKKLYEHLSHWLRDYISNMAGLPVLLILHLDDSFASAVTLSIANDSHSSSLITVVADPESSIFDFAETLGVNVSNPVSWSSHGDHIKDADLPRTRAQRLVLGNKTRNECELVRSYHKHWNSYDISVVRDIFDSELLDLFNYKNLDGQFSSPNKIKGFTPSEIEWADNFNKIKNVIISPDIPSSHPSWQGLSARQRAVIAKIHQIEKLTKHKEFLKIPPSFFKEKSIKGVLDCHNCLDKKSLEKLGVKYKGLAH